MIAAPHRLDAYFDEAAAAFARAAARAGGAHDRTLSIAGHGARLRFAGPALAARLLPALQHLPGDAAPAPALTVMLWDAESTDTLLPPPPWDALGFHERGATRGHADPRFSLVFDRRTDVFSAVDAERRLAVYWTRQGSALPYHEVAAPMRRLLQGWLQGHGLFLAHAAAVGRPDGGVLLAGRTGSGKSTTAVLALRAGLLYASDDYTLVRAGPSPHVYSLYSTAKLNAETLAWVPEVAPAVGNPDRLDREKALLFLAPRFGSRVARSFPLRAILLPRPTGGAGTAVTPVSPSAAYRAMAPDTVFTSLGDARTVLRAFNTLVHALPAYDLALGNDPDGVGDAIRRVLADAPAAPRPAPPGPGGAAAAPAEPAW
jgi:hypothetical protein